MLDAFQSVVFIIMDKVVEAVARPIHGPKDPCLGIASLQDHPRGAIPVG
jgi:hypothetical protein